MGTVAQTHEPLSSPLPRVAGEVGPVRSRSTVHSVMAAPLLIGRRLVGAIATVHSDPPGVFNNEDLRRLNLFAPQAAIAIENARLFTAARREPVLPMRWWRQPRGDRHPRPAGTITSRNPAFERLFGWQQDEAVGRNLDELINVAETLAEAMPTPSRPPRRPARGIGKRRRKDGTFLDVELFGGAGGGRTANGPASSASTTTSPTCSGPTSRPRRPTAPRASSSPSMSHELRTPLNAIIGYSEMLEEEAADSGQAAFTPDLRRSASAGSICSGPDQRHPRPLQDRGREHGPAPRAGGRSRGLVDDVVTTVTRCRAERQPAGGARPATTWA